MTDYQKLEVITKKLSTDLIIIKLAEIYKINQPGIFSVLLGELENRLGEDESDKILDEIKKTK